MKARLTPAQRFVLTKMRNGYRAYEFGRGAFMVSPPCPTDPTKGWGWAYGRLIWPVTWRILKERGLVAIAEGEKWGNYRDPDPVWGLSGLLERTLDEDAEGGKR